MPEDKALFAFTNSCDRTAQLPKNVILYAVFFYVRYGVSYRDLEEIMIVHW